MSSEMRIKRARAWFERLTLGRFSSFGELEEAGVLVSCFERLTLGRYSSPDEVKAAGVWEDVSGAMIEEGLLDIWEYMADIGGYDWDGIEDERRFCATYYILMCGAALPDISSDIVCEFEEAALRGGLESGVSAYLAGVPAADIVA